MNKNKGFTLIELLVVIAIIGILASVVLASLSSARNKGKDAAVKSQLASMRAQAELYNSTADTYAGVCTAAQTANGFGGPAADGGAASAGLLKAVQDSEGLTTTITTALTTAGAFNNITCHDSADAWVVSAPLTDSVSGTPSMYCVDSLGSSKATGTTVLAGSDLDC